MSTLDLRQKIVVVNPEHWVPCVCWVGVLNRKGQELGHDRSVPCNGGRDEEFLRAPLEFVAGVLRKRRERPKASQS